ncbi:MAG TPA: Rieske 2Fe-2S domain-containing protein [Chloroflexota bacterium]|jgi:5,5'-dehydrodivanillate O-demethylase
MVAAKSETEGAVIAAPDCAHTGPGTLAGRFMRRFWQPVYLARQLAPGHAKPIRIMSEDFTLYRGEGGAPHVVAYRCAHRGTQLSTGWVEGDCLRCFYHGWKYDGLGQCVEMPAEDASFPPKVQIKSYPTREHLGLIFAYLGEGEPPSFPPYPAFRGEGLIDTWVFPAKNNFFQTYENSADEVHVAFVHRMGGSHQGLYDLPRITAEETEYGLIRYGTRASGDVRVSLHLVPTTTRVIIPPMAGLEGAGGWRDTYLTWVPVDDTQHLAFLTQLVPLTGEDADAYVAQRERYMARSAAARPTTEVTADVLAGRLRLAEIEHPDLVVIQDEASQKGQGIIEDRAGEHLGRSDVGVLAIRRVWERELRALAEGRPLKQWRCPDDLSPVLGF